MPKSSRPIAEMSASTRSRFLQRLRERAHASVRDEIGDANGVDRVNGDDAVPVRVVDVAPLLENDANAQNEMDVERQHEDLPNHILEDERDEESGEEQENDDIHEEDQEADDVDVDRQEQEEILHEVEGEDGGMVNNEEPDDGEDGEEEQDDEEDGVDIEVEDFGMRPLYRNAPLSVRESAAAMLAFMVNHNLSASCLEDLMNLVKLHCHQEDFVKLSLYKLKKYFNFKYGNINKRYYCSACSRGLENPQDICDVCERRRPVSYFIQNPLVPQLEKLFARPNFYVKLQNRFARRRFNVENLEDIYDGLSYREQVQTGFLADANNFSMTFYTDGVPVFKSKNYSFWPFFLTINELPYKERMKRENTLLAGLWFGPKKPNANLFLLSFRDDFRLIYQGVRVYVADLQTRNTIKGILLAGVCDLPAKSSFLYVVAHNGYHGCPVCEIRGEGIVLPNGNDTHAYRYVWPVQKRSVQRMQDQAREVLEVNQADFTVMGVKGPTALRLIMPDFLRGSAIDFMHLIMGVVRKLMTLHFDSQHGNEIWSLRDVMHVVDRMYLAMKPPRFVHRLPRTVDDICHWKASELKIWLYYYSVPILKEVMTGNYFNHYLKLVIALSYLSASSISGAMIEIAEELLHQFVREFPDLYGLRFCSINIHMLLHAADCVRELGPAWVYSCFPYENMNGQYLRVIHGKTDVDSQITRMHSQILDFPKKFHFLPEGPVKDYCQQQKGQLKVSERLNASCYVVGCYNERDDDDLVVRQTLRNANIRYNHVNTYYRLLKDSLVYVAETYTRDTKYSSSYVAYDNDNDVSYGRVYKFVKTMNCHCNMLCNCCGTHYAIIKRIHKAGQINILRQQDVKLKYLHRCDFSLELTPVLVQSLKTVCFFMNINNVYYIAEPVNSSEIE